MEPWSQENPWYISISDTLSIEEDYPLTYNVAMEDARTTPGSNVGTTCGTSTDGTTTPSNHPGVYCADGWDLYTYTFEGVEHHSCFWFGNPDEQVYYIDIIEPFVINTIVQVSYSNAKGVCESMNGFLPEIPNGPNLNHWIVEKLLQKYSSNLKSKI